MPTLPLPHDIPIYVFLSKPFSDAADLARPIRWHGVVGMCVEADAAMVPVRRGRQKRPLGTPDAVPHPSPNRDAPTKN